MTPRSRNQSLLGIAVLAVVLAGPVIGQQPAAPEAPPTAPRAAPKSLLPDDFEPAPSRPEAAAPLLLPQATPGSAPARLPPLLAPPPKTDASETVGTTGETTPNPLDVSVASGRDIAVIGPLTPSMGGYGAGLFSGSRGRFLAGLANRLTAPIGSRWAAITFNRALLSESAAPAGIYPADWVAVRTWAVLRMGEIDGAKRLVDSVPVDRYTPSLYRVAAQAALAAADINGLCPIAANGRVLSKDPLWDLAIGMCAALQGDDITAAEIFDTLAEDEGRVDPFDVRLGERVATIAGGAGRAAIIDWNEAPRLTPFRYAVATASGVPVPAETLAALGPARAGWVVRNPGVSAETRLELLRQAAVLGTLSASEIASGIGALSTADEPESRAALLRTAFAGGSAADRRDALRSIIASGDGDERYGALLEAATAAARLPISADSAEDSADIIAALLAAGDGRTALRWWRIAEAASPAVRARAWALLATGTGGVAATPADFDDWRTATKASDHQAAMLLAALAGLGTASGSGGGSEWASAREDLLPATANSWTRAIDAAAAGRRAGEAIILSATGLQGAWKDVPPQHLEHILAALTRVGRGAEARLIAAEAVTRA